MERGDDMWYVSRWFDEVLTLSSEKRDPPHLKRKRTDGTSNVFYLTVKLCGEKEEDEEDSNGMEDITSDLKETERGKYSCTWPINNVESNKHKHFSKRWKGIKKIQHIGANERIFYTFLQILCHKFQ